MMNDLRLHVRWTRLISVGRRMNLAHICDTKTTNSCWGQYSPKLYPMLNHWQPCMLCKCKSWWDTLWDYAGERRIKWHKLHATINAVTKKRTKIKYFIFIHLRKTKNYLTVPRSAMTARMGGATSRTGFRRSYVSSDGDRWLACFLSPAHRVCVRAFILAS